MAARCSVNDYQQRKDPNIFMVKGGQSIYNGPAKGMPYACKGDPGYITHVAERTWYLKGSPFTGWTSLLETSSHDHRILLLATQ